MTSEGDECAISEDRKVVMLLKALRPARKKNTRRRSRQQLRESSAGKSAKVVYLAILFRLLDYISSVDSFVHIYRFR